MGRHNERSAALHSPSKSEGTAWAAESDRLDGGRVGKNVRTDYCSKPVTELKLECRRMTDKNKAHLA